MKLMQVIAGRRHGGAELFFERHAMAMSATGIDQQVVIRNDPAWAARLRANGITVHQARFGGVLDFSTKRVVAGHAKAFQPDVVLTWMKRGTIRTPAGKHLLCGRLDGYYNLKYYRHCDHLIGITPGLRRYLTDHGWPEDRAHYLPNFVDEEPAAAADRGQFETPPDAPLVFALGRLHPVKGFGMLLAAMVGIPDGFLWLAGEGPERKALTAQAEALGIARRVRFLGWRDDIPSLMAAADVMAFPSRHESFGHVMLEAWAQGRAVVSTNTAGPGETIRNGENGVLVANGDRAAFTVALRQLIDDPTLRCALGKAGRETLDQHFSKAAVVRQYQAFFDSVTRGR